MLIFERLTNELNSHSLSLHAAELHGMLVGYACDVETGVSNHGRSVQYKKWLGIEPPSAIFTILESGYLAAIENLGEFSDFEFRLLLPRDDAPITERVDAISRWCSGFLLSINASGRSFDALDVDVGEALTDLKTIAEMGVIVPEGEDNEVDLAEIEEFVRFIVYMIFAEFNSRSSH